MIIISTDTLTKFHVLTWIAQILQESSFLSDKMLRVKSKMVIIDSASSFYRNWAKLKISKKLEESGWIFVGIIHKSGNVENDQSVIAFWKELINFYIQISWANEILGALI